MDELSSVSELYPSDVSESSSSDVTSDDSEPATSCFLFSSLGALDSLSFLSS